MSLWTFSLQDRKTKSFGAVPSSTPTNAVFSPDGLWVAYASTDQGPTTTFVQPFPASGARYQLGSMQAIQPLWSPDGKELFYNPRPGAFEAVTVTTHPTLVFGNPVAVPKPFQTGPPASRRAFDITAGGKFLGLIPEGLTESATREMNTQIRVVLTLVRGAEGARAGEIASGPEALSDASEASLRRRSRSSASASRRGTWRIVRVFMNVPPCVHMHSSSDTANAFVSGAAVLMSGRGIMAAR